MEILVVPDKFKHSLSSFEACEAIKKGILAAGASTSVTLLPVSDGGDGLLEILSRYTPSEERLVEVFDPLMRKIPCSYLISKDGKTAFIEMAKASGLMLLKKEEYNPLVTSTYGTGQLIRDAITENVSKIILGIGGSATNDGGIGMAAALGFRFLDKSAYSLIPNGENLRHIGTIDSTNAIDLKQVSFEVACDVTNPLLGAEGASSTFAPQKGASPEMVFILEEGMANYVRLIELQLGIDIASLPGAGAAGGLGAGCIAFLNAHLRLGIDLIFDYTDADKLVQSSDLVITGEGKLDQQSINGKVISGIGRLCRKHNKPLYAFCGQLELQKDELIKNGITDAFCINKGKINLQDAYRNAEKALTEAVEKNLAEILS